MRSFARNIPQAALGLFVMLALPLAVMGRTREFTILGHQKIRAAVKRGMPLPAEKDGVRIEAAAFRTGEEGLAFCFLFTTDRAPIRVLVEDVTGDRPVALVEDATPTLEQHRWSGIAKARPITPEAVPWVFEVGNTTKVFRFTVTFAGAKTPVVLFQPAVYSADVKRLLGTR